MSEVEKTPENRDEDAEDSCSEAPEESFPNAAKFGLESIKDQENIIGYVKPTYGEYEVYNTIIERENQRKVNSIMNKYDLKFSKILRLAIKSIKIEDILPYFDKLGSIFILGEESCIVQNDDVFYHIYIPNEYITNLAIKVFSTSIEKVLTSCEIVNETLNDIIIHNEVNMELNWYYYSHPKVKNYYVTEELNDAFIREAYPYLDVDQMISDYLTGAEPVLILMGPPGTGKTRLIRYILKNIFIKYNSLRVAFTADQNVIENSEIFLDFLLGEFSTLVIEDIDYHLRPRKDGNVAMYNFLTASNSIIVNYFVNKRIILSTNLSDVKNIDEALVRPGRCFDIIETRYLTNEEANDLMKVIDKDKSLPEKKYTIAEIFNSGGRRNRIKKSGF